jgi:hypothetical protein
MAARRGATGWVEPGHGVLGVAEAVVGAPVRIEQLDPDPRLAIDTDRSDNCHPSVRQSGNDGQVRAHQVVDPSRHYSSIAERWVAPSVWARPDQRDIARTLARYSGHR